MKYRAVIFDLFGTLIPNFSAAEYQQTVYRMAEILKAPPELFWGRWTALFKEGILGIFQTPEAKIEHIGLELGLSPDLAAISRAASIRYEYEAATMTPRPEAVPVLKTLKSRGLKIGLITDCSAEAPAEWPNSPLAPWFDATIFSCRVGMKKPDPRIYLLALHELAVTPPDTLYIGDGSSRELSGASAVGIRAIHLKIPSETHPDVFRLDQEDWRGESIASLEGLPLLLV